MGRYEKFWRKRQQILISHSRLSLVFTGKRLEVSGAHRNHTIALQVQQSAMSKGHKVWIMMDYVSVGFAWFEDFQRIVDT